MTDQKKTHTQSQNSKTVVDSRQSQSTLHRVLSIKKPLYICTLVALFLLSLGAGVFLYLQDKNDSKYVFTIEDKSYTKDEVTKLTEYPVKVEQKTQNVAAEELYEALRLVKAGTNNGIDMTDTSIKPQLQQIYEEGEVSESDQKKYEDWFRIKAQSFVVTEAMSSAEIEGYLYDFYFGQHVQYGPRYKPEGLGDAKLIAQDKQYAKERANHYRSSLESGVISPEQALQEIKQDPKLGNDSSSSSNHSVYFASTPGEQNWQQQIYSKDIADFILNQKTLNKPSAVQTGKALASPDSTQAEDMNFYFIYLKKTSHSKVDPVKLSKALAALKSEYKGFKK